MIWPLLFAWFAFAQDPVPPPAQPPAEDIKSIMDTGYARYMRGEYDAAREQYLKAWDLADATPPENPARYDILKRLTAVRAAVGDFADADYYLKLAIAWRERTLGNDDPKIPEDMLQDVALCRGMKDYGRALALVNEVLLRHSKIYKFESVEVADDYSRMAQILLEQKKPEDSISPLNTALQIRTKLYGPLDPSLVYDLDRLGTVQTALRAYDKSEEAFRHALVIRESLYGKQHADLIATVDGLAYAYFGEKKFDEADAAYHRLVGLWESSVGPNHPMVAFALDKVAIFYSEQKKYDQAKEASDRAIAIRTYSLGNNLAEAAAEQMTEGNKDAAVALYRRALTVLDPPHPIYAEMRAQIEQLLHDIAPMTSKALTKKTPVTARKK